MVEQDEAAEVIYTYNQIQVLHPAEGEKLAHYATQIPLLKNHSMQLSFKTQVHNSRFLKTVYRASSPGDQVDILLDCYCKIDFEKDPEDFNPIIIEQYMLNKLETSIPPAHLHVSDLSRCLICFLPMVSEQKKTLSKKHFTSVMKRLLLLCENYRLHMERYKKFFETNRDQISSIFLDICAILFST